MPNLQDIINLAKADGGKFFVMDEQGNANLVILSVAEYQKLLLGKLQKQVMDVENINQQIMQAIEEEEQNPIEEVLVSQKKPVNRQDLREEVIDPSFDFEGPKIGFDDF